MAAAGTYVIFLRLAPAFTANLARSGVMDAVTSAARDARDARAPSVEALVALGVDEDFARLFVERLGYLLRLRRHGVLLSAGPFADLTEGLYVCKAADDAEARRVIEDDPLYRAGFIERDVVIRRWLAAI
ncbi:MAG: YciI family protein [Bradyrhizobium guangdongense]